MNMTFGQRVRSLRIDANITEENLALKVRVPVETVRDWESDVSVPSGVTLCSLASQLWSTPEELLTGNAPE